MTEKFFLQHIFFNGKGVLELGIHPALGYLTVNCAIYNTGSIRAAASYAQGWMGQELVLEEIKGRG